MVKLDEEIISSGLESCANLYEPIILYKYPDSSFDRSIEAYEDDGFIYIYIFGGQNASTYFAKLVFNETGYITSIIVDYMPLSMHGSFGENFIGF